MPKSQVVVINTTPIISLVAALGDLSLLNLLYNKVYVSYEVGEEIMAHGSEGFAVRQYQEATWLTKLTEPVKLSSLLKNVLDIGEASVIQVALDYNVKTVCIDETVGRRFARLSGLALTGSLGILLRAKQEGHNISIKSSIEQMRVNGIWLSESLIAAVLVRAGE